MKRGECARNCRGAPWAAVCLGILLFPAAASAEQFAYVDRNGVVHQISVGSSDLEAAPLPTPAPAVAEPYGRVEEFPYATLVREAASLHSLPVELISAVMLVEAGFDPRAVSSAGAVGLMQRGWEPPLRVAHTRLTDSVPGSTRP